MRPAAASQIDPTAVRRRDRRLVLACGRPALGPDVLLAVPDEQALILALSALRDHGDEELIGLQVVGGMPAVVAGVVTALDVSPGLVAMPVGEHPRPSGGDQEQRMTTTNAWGFDDFPAVDESQIFEVLKPHLAGAEAGEEELFDLEGVQVAVVVERLEDEQVALVESSMQTAELGLSGMRLGLRRKVSQDDRMSWDERPSWFKCRAELSSGGLRSVLRFLRRRPQRIPRSEVRSELEFIGGAVRVVVERVRVGRHH